ncbi:MAG: hypothetical protein ACKVX9_20405 [Blastocatellia bacterium]
MFENENDKVIERERSRALLWVGAAGAVALAVLILVLVKARPEDRPVIEDVLRAGTPEFDGYKDRIEMEIIDKVVHPNMLGMAQYEVRARIHNRGDRTLTAIELTGQMVGLDDKTIKQIVSIPIPRGRPEPLPPGDSIAVSVKIEAPGKVTEDMIKDLVIELRGLKFQ